MKIDRQKVLEMYSGHCGYCGDPIDLKTMQVDHKVSKQYHPYMKVKYAINNIENLMPSCKQCKHYKREKCIESSGYHIGYRDYMMKFHIRLGKLPKKTQVTRTENRIKYMWCIANKYGITPDKSWCGKFWYEQQPVTLNI